jgi:predicted ATP-grasp superfamily ATP-dependent carboligase
MRVFVFEYITGGGLADRPMVSGLAGEGELMLKSLLSDLVQIPGVEVLTTRDARLDPLGLPVNVLWVYDRCDLARCWEHGVYEADAVWPIAPETDGLLEDLCDFVTAANRLLLNSRPEAVRVAASKLATATRLRGCGLPAVETWKLDMLPPLDRGHWVLKPDQGVGCLRTRLCRGAEALCEALGRVEDPDGWVMQPYVAGKPASLSLLVDDDECCLLGCNQQRVALLDDGFVLFGCEVNGLEGDWTRYDRLGRAVAQAIPGLWGHVGVDLIVTDDGPVILEVNPRLTTSFAGLSRSLGRNVAAMVVGSAQGTSAIPVDRLAGRRVDVDLELCRVA